MKIGVDLDGVVVDMGPVLLRQLSTICGREIRVDEIYCYDLETALSLDERQIEQLLEIVRSETTYLTAPAMDGALEALSALKQHDVIFVTSRPEEVRQATETWLRSHGLEHRDVVFTGHGKKVAGTMGLNVFIEDDIGTALGLASAGLSVLLFDHPWNQGDGLPFNCRRVRDWREISGYLAQW
ncbi:MAG: hypothetical protein HY675_27010 [Chloroflexi bacterium]|nr:hypothetical protein [Chloroflexota bacterium]